MASRGHTAPPVSVHSQHENGEVILAEGIRDGEAVCTEVCGCYIFIAIISVLLLSPLMLVLGIYFTYKARTSWRLYLTPTGVHYSSVGPFHCDYKKIFVPLRDIQNVSVRTTVYTRRRYGAVVSTHARYSVILKIDPSKFGDFLTCCQRCGCYYKEGVELKGMKNSKEFATAVAQQMVRQGLTANNTIYTVKN